MQLSYNYNYNKKEKCIFSMLARNTIDYIQICRREDA